MRWVQDSNSYVTVLMEVGESFGALDEAGEHVVSTAWRTEEGNCLLLSIMGLTISVVHELGQL